jgi:hypothetical protein
MAVIPVTPLFLKDTLIEIAGSDYAPAVSSVAFTPTSTSVTFTGLKKDAVFTDVGNTTWTVALTFVQDWDTATSLRHRPILHGKRRDRARCNRWSRRSRNRIHRDARSFGSTCSRPSRLVIEINQGRAVAA